MAATILIVEDDPAIRELLSINLEASAHRVIEAGSAEEAEEAMHHSLPDLILLDWMLPGRSGPQFAQRIRATERTKDVPIIMLTARTDEHDRVTGLEIGADDYMVKPFSPRELIARIKAVLRRTRGTFTPEQGPIELKVGDLFINSKSHTVTVAGKPVELTAKEFDLLFALAVEPERVFTIDELLSRVWGAEFHGQPQIVYVNIRWLRQKIEPDPAQPTHLISIRGAGYKLTATGQNGA